VLDVDGVLATTGCFAPRRTLKTFRVRVGAGVVQLQRPTRRLPFPARVGGGRQTHGGTERAACQAGIPDKYAALQELLDKLLTSDVCAL
jgi:3-deoxy-D-manno-octulosonate 8-phosphate phosphatase KdsC-like HAD superfamily phosphatase